MSRVLNSSTDHASMDPADAELLEEYRQDSEQAPLAEFDCHGRVLQGNDPRFAGIQGLAKVTLPPKLHSCFRTLNEHIKQQVPNMVSWAGVDNDTTKLRAMAFLNQDRLDRLDSIGIQIRDAYKTDESAERDEKANRKACMVLEDDEMKKTEAAAKELLELLKQALPNEESLTLEELIVIQPNLHNGASFLKAHMDFPHNDGFGKAIVTVAVSGAATILLYGPWNGEQHPVWRFRLDEGECYCLTGLARTMCYHAVYSPESVERESLNLRFGLHSIQDLEKEEWIDSPHGNSD